MTYICQKCGGDIRSVQFANRATDRWLTAALSLHEDHCTGSKRKDSGA